MAYRSHSRKLERRESREELYLEKMKKYRVAFTGVFDIDNYGDHLFPLIFRKVLDEKKIEYEIVLFSPIGGVQGYRQNEKVYPLSLLDELHKQSPFDVVVIGGGGILHYASGKQKMSLEADEFKDYRVFETWIFPSLFAIKNKVRIVWNLPGGFHEFSGCYKPLTRALCIYVDYMSVRDNYTKEILSNCNISKEKIGVCLDSAFVMRKYIPDELLERGKKNVAGFKSPYIVYHANRYLPKEAMPELVRILNKLKGKGYEIVLLPIAYTHDDQEVLERIQDFSIACYGEVGRFFIPEKELSVYDIMSILAYAQMYIGVSFHGAVTALCHKRKAIAFDYMKNGKTENLFQTLRLDEYYITDIKELENAVNRCLNEFKSPELEGYVVALEKHFDKIIETMKAPYVEKEFKIFLESYSDFISSLSEEHNDYISLKQEFRRLDELSKATNICYEREKYENSVLKENYKSKCQELENIKGKKAYKIYKKISSIKKIKIHANGEEK